MDFLVNLPKVWDYVTCCHEIIGIHPQSEWIRWPLQDHLCRKARIVSSTETCHSNQSHGECHHECTMHSDAATFPMPCVFLRILWSTKYPPPTLRHQRCLTKMAGKIEKKKQKTWKNISKGQTILQINLRNPPELCLAVPPSSHQRASGDRSIGDSRWLIERCSSTWNFTSGFPYYPTVPKKTWWLPQREMIHSTSHFAKLEEIYSASLKKTHLDELFTSHISQAA